MRPSGRGLTREACLELAGPVEASVAQRVSARSWPRESGEVMLWQSDPRDAQRCPPSEGAQLPGRTPRPLLNGGVGWGVSSPIQTLVLLLLAGVPDGLRYRISGQLSSEGPAWLDQWWKCIRLKVFSHPGGCRRKMMVFL